MPFGLCNAPATFERMMDNLLRHFKWTMCLCYLDDIIVFSETFEDHLIRLRLVLKCLQEAGLKLNSKKCLFAAQEVKILGHLVSSNGVRPDPDKIKAVRNFPTPKNIHDIRSFLGLCSYFRRFIKGFCYLAEPLQSLLKSGVEFHWGPEEVEAFNSLKKALTSDPVLGMYDERASTEIHTDASGYGIGAVLVQIQNNVEKVIAYASRTLTKAEKNYSTTERECLAIVWATNKFRPYIFGKHFTVVTDHHSLCWLMNLKDPSGRLARWALRLQEHDFDIKYKTGKKHSDADALSRNPVEEETETPDKFLAVTTSMNLAMEQKKDKDLAKLKLLSNSSKNEEFRFIDGILCRKNFDPDGKLWLPVIPKHLRADILRHFHDAPPQDTLVSRKLMTGFARDFTGRECTEMSFVPIPPAIAPFHRIGIDLLGRFPKSAHGNKWIIVCTDYSTRYAITKALPTAEVDEIAKFLLEEIVLRHGAPRVIITDRGAVFRSRLVSSLVDLCNIDHRFTTAYHPQTNGLTERFNKTLADMLSMYVDVEQKNWDEILPFVTFAYNTAKQETTGFTPFYLLHGREAETTLDTMLPFCPNDFDDNNITKIAARAEESRQLARVHTLRAQDKDRRRYDSKHQMVSYAPGDLVWIYTPVRKVGLSEKLLRRYFGPYQVLRRLSAVTYEVQDFDPASRKRKLREVVHVLRMKPYHDPAEQIETEDIPPKESYKGPITRSRIKTLEQNDSGALSSFFEGSNATRIICYKSR
ncbi:retrovirus-related Pol polyprotein from transposon 17.6 [Trichonephila clavipes]|nr:retrovirus-related Pol polyprotein from transposon 17.6 [Trichonephila clavipes]